MKLIRAEIDNVLRLKAAHFDLADGVTVVAGRNAQGKSSVLNAIQIALGGAKHTPDNPVHDGATRGTVVLRTDTLQVTRKLRAGGKATLEVVSLETGEVQPSPQKLLDSLFDTVGFDPHAFSRLKPKEQADRVRDLFGIDTTALEVRRKRAYEDRTEAGREAKRLEGVVSELRPVEAGLERVDVAKLLARLQHVETKAAAAREAETTATRAEEDLGVAKLRLREAEELVERLETELEMANQTWVDADNARAEAERAQEDPQPIREALAAAEDTNRRVDAGERREQVTAELRDADTEYERLTGELAEIDEEIAKVIREANFPVDAMGFDPDGGLILNGQPFAQASSAEQLRAAVAIGMASKPELRLFLVREGSLLDDDSLQLLAELAAENDAQVIAERVGPDKRATIVIEDGEIVDLPPIGRAALEQLKRDFPREDTPPDAEGSDDPEEVPADGLDPNLLTPEQAEQLGIADPPDDENPMEAKGHDLDDIF